MKIQKTAGAVVSDPAAPSSGADDVPALTIGTRIAGPGHGIVVDMDADSVVVARKNARGRCMDLVFVGDAIRTLRPA